MRATGWIRVGAFALAVAAHVAPVHAARFETGLGYTDEISGERTAMITLGVVGDQKHPFEAMLGYIPKRGNLPLSKDTLFLAFAKRFELGHWFASSGVAAASGDGEVLSGTFQFLTGIGYERDRWSVSVRHLSNAGLRGRNRGDTFLVATWAW